MGNQYIFVIHSNEQTKALILQEIKRNDVISWTKIDEEISKIVAIIPIVKIFTRAKFIESREEEGCFNEHNIIGELKTDHNEPEMMRSIHHNGWINFSQRQYLAQKAGNEFDISFIRKTNSGDEFYGIISSSYSIPTTPLDLRGIIELNTIA